MSVTLSDERFADRAGAPGSARTAVSAHHVSKSFRLPHQQYHTVKERALHPFRSRSFDVLQAVRDVSIDVAQGEFFGIVGRNGSGKSTLLKCLAGIYQIDEGELAINGRLSPFIELGVGFNPDLTARDNVIINAIMLGLTRKQARERFDDIIAFAELERFIDLKLKNYSAGMYVRLAFATAVQADADILLIDEVLAVGDAAFQQKCFDEFTRLQEAGRTMLFVTHEMGAIERFCNRAMLLEHGRVVDIGDPVSIARQYNRLNFDRLRVTTSASDSDSEPADGEGGGTAEAEVLKAWFESSDGEVALDINQGEPCTIRMKLRFVAEVENPIFAFALHDEAGHTAFATNTVARRIETGRFLPGNTATVTVRFENWLAPGRYRLFATVARAGLGADVLDAHITTSLIVVSEHPGGGMTDPPHTFQIDRA